MSFFPWIKQVFWKKCFFRKTFKFVYRTIIYLFSCRYKKRFAGFVDSDSWSQSPICSPIFSIPGWEVAIQWSTARRCWHQSFQEASAKFLHSVKYNAWKMKKTFFFERLNHVFSPCFTFFFILPNLILVQKTPVNSYPDNSDLRWIRMHLRMFYHPVNSYFSSFVLFYLVPGDTN